MLSLLEPCCLNENASAEKVGEEVISTGRFNVSLTDSAGEQAGEDTNDECDDLEECSTTLRDSNSMIPDNLSTQGNVTARTVMTAGSVIA